MGVGRSVVAAGAALAVALAASPAVGGTDEERGGGPWRALPDAPLALVDHTAVWDGKRMLFWGGVKESPVPAAGPYREGGMAYDPARDQWRPIAPGPAPMTYEQGGFAGDIAVWTGQEALFWGDHAAAYDPARDQWRQMAQAPKHCRDAPTVWSGTEMVVWGGHHGGDAYYTFYDGIAYRPSADSDPPPRATTTTGPQWAAPHQYHCGGS